MYWSGFGLYFYVDIFVIGDRTMSKMRLVLCSNCKGIGRKGANICHECDGEGYVEKEKSRKKKKQIDKEKRKKD